MSVGTWGPGTGATGTGSHPFCLRIQGVDYIGSVDLSSIVVNASVSSNATLTFTAWDSTSALPIPQGWADVEFLDTTEQEWIFGGLVMGVEVSPWAAAGRRIDVRCVDYGILLDVTPVMESMTLSGASDYLLHGVVQKIAGVSPLGGITATLYTTGGDGRVAALIDQATPGEYYQIPIAIAATETIAAGSMARAALDTYAARAEDVFNYTPAAATPADVYVTPLKQLAVRPYDKSFGTAPLEIRENPTTASHVSAGSATMDYDFRGMEGGVRVADADTTTGGDNSAWQLGTVNGYTVMPASLSVALPDAGQAAIEGAIYIEAHASGTASGQATVTTVKNFQPGQALTVYYPSIDLDGTYAITAVTTRFLGGGLKRQSTIQFNGERGTVSRFNRTRFARAGVTT